MIATQFSPSGIKPSSQVVELASATTFHVCVKAGLEAAVLIRINSQGTEFGSMIMNRELSPSSVEISVKHYGT